MRKNLYDKLWEAHVVRDNSDGTCLLSIDRHLVHEVTSPNAGATMLLVRRGCEARRNTAPWPLQPPVIPGNLSPGRPGHLP